MRVLPTSLVVSLLFSAPLPALAQGEADASGHWEGVIATPMMGDIPVGFDLARKADGSFIGTFDDPAEHVHGMPLLKVEMDGAAVTVDLASANGGRFEGLLTGDGSRMIGDFHGPFATVPFNMTRNGPARFEPEPKGAAVEPRAEGAWTGSIQFDEGAFPLELHVVNHPDGTSTAFLVDIPESGIEVPVSLEQHGATLEFHVGMTGGHYTGTLNAAGAEISGTYVNGNGEVAPLAFRRMAAAEGARAR